MEERKDLFLHSEGQPPIKAFTPRVDFNKVDETALRDLIMQSEITNAVFDYNLMKQKGIEVSSEIKQSLLELVCFYYNCEPLSEELIEERFFKLSTAGRKSQSSSWKDGELAQNLFPEIELKTSSSYAAIIRGMAKYYQAERAYALLQNATEKQLVLDTQTFISIIAITHLLKESTDQRWDLCNDLLQQMAQQQLCPNCAFQEETKRSQGITHIHLNGHRVIAARLCDLLDFYKRITKVNKSTGASHLLIEELICVVVLLVALALCVNNNNLQPMHKKPQERK